MQCPGPPSQTQGELIGSFRGELDSGELGEIRDTVNRNWSLGSERFKDEIEPKRARPTRSIMLQGNSFGRGKVTRTLFIAILGSGTA